MDFLKNWFGSKPQEAVNFKDALNEFFVEAKETVLGLLQNKTRLSGILISPFLDTLLTHKSHQILLKLLLYFFSSSPTNC